MEREGRRLPRTARQNAISLVQTQDARGQPHLPQAMFRRKDSLGYKVEAQMPNLVRTKLVDEMSKSQVFLLGKKVKLHFVE